MRLPASVELGNRITAAEAAKRYRLPNGYKTLCKAIGAGIVRGQRVDVGRRSIHLVDPAELEEDLANLPECGYPGCSRKAFAPSGACSGPHARALETKGTKLTAETRGRMSESQTRRHRRADEELARLNADGYLNLRQIAAERSVAPNTVSYWVAEGFLRAKLHVVEQEHLLIVSRKEFKRFNAEEWPRLRKHVGSRILPHWSPLSKRRQAGRAHGHKGAEHGHKGAEHGHAGGATPKATPEQAKEVWRLSRENLSPYRISELVFGDRRFHMRVRRIIGIS